MGKHAGGVSRGRVGRISQPRSPWPIPQLRTGRIVSRGSPQKSRRGVPRFGERHLQNAPRFCGDGGLSGFVRLNAGRPPQPTSTLAISLPLPSSSPLRYQLA